MIKVAILAISILSLFGCTIGVPAGRLLSDGVKDFCSHTKPHKDLIMEEANEAVTERGMIDVTCKNTTND